MESPARSRVRTDEAVTPKLHEGSAITAHRDGRQEMKVLSDIFGMDVEAARELLPMFLEKPLSEPLGPIKDSETPEVNKMTWKRIQDGWTVYQACPDTGATVSVGPADMAQGHRIKENAASKEGRGFVSASKHTIPCVGELDVPMQSPEGLWTRQTWQIAPEGTVARPLLSIGEECDRGNVVVFGKAGGAIIHLESKTARGFPRKATGAYEIEMWLPPVELVGQMASAGFTRQGD